MEITSLDRQFLDMSPQEARVFEALQGNRDKISNIARLTRLPHSTVTFLLKKLQNRGLVERIRTWNHYEWRVCNEVEIADRMKNVVRDLLTNPSIGNLTTEHMTIEVFDAKESEKNIYELAKRILTFNKNDRVYYIQSLASAKKQITTLSKQFLKEYHYELKRKRIIMETIGGQSLMEVFKDLSFEELAGHHGRRTVAYIVPDELINFPADIVMYRDTVVIIDYDHGTMMHIKNALTATIFLNLFELIKLHAKKHDLNAHILKLMEKRRPARLSRPLTSFQAHYGHGNAAQHHQRNAGLDRGQ